VHSGHSVRRAHGVKDAALERRRHDVGHLLGGQEHGLVLRRPIGLSLLHEVGHRREGVVVDGGFDVKHTHGVLDELALPDA